MTGRSRLVMAMLLTVAGVSADGRQLKPAAVGTGVIAGRVVDARSGAPVSGAHVHVMQVNPPIGINGRYENTVSDATGHFAFNTLPAGRFEVSASQPAYLAGNVGKLRADGEGVWIRLDDGGRAEATVRMIPAASIGGVVVDERNAPVAGARVEAWRDISTNGEPIYEDRPETVKTSVDGSYRFENLKPGRYVVRLTMSHATRREELGGRGPCAPPEPPPPPGGAALSVLKPPDSKPAAHQTDVEPPQGFSAPAPAPNGSVQTYVSTFFPDATDPRQAITLTVNPGDDRLGVYLQARVTPAATVTGTLIREGGRGIGNATRVELRRLTTEPASAIAEATAFLDPETHRFTFAAVPPGPYSMEIALAQSGGCDNLFLDGVITRQDIVVPPEGLKDVDVAIVEGQRLEGDITFAGTGSRPMVDVGVTPVGVAYRFGEPLGYTEGSRVIFEGLTPGRYVISAHDNAPNGRWFVNAISYRGQDLAAEMLVVDGPVSDRIEIAMTDRPSSLKGVAVSANGTPVADATIVAFPTDRRLWTAAHPRMMRFAMIRALNGQFEFRHLIPGDYFVAAVDERTMDAWPSVGFLTQVAAVAARVRMAAGQSQEVALPFAQAGIK